jgi:hypothetical protein
MAHVLEEFNKVMWNIQQLNRIRDKSYLNGVAQEEPIIIYEILAQYFRPILEVFIL